MPIYEYACQDCGKEFELLVRSDTVLACPQCHATSLEKKLSVFSPSVPSASAPAPMSCGACPHAGDPSGCAMH